MQTKEQEFLEELTDPIQFRIDKAIREFKKAHGHMITDVMCWRHPKTFTSEFRIDMIAKEHGPLLALSGVFTDYLLEYLPDAKINTSTYVAQDKQDMIKTYTVAL